MLPAKRIFKREERRNVFFVTDGDVVVKDDGREEGEGKNDVIVSLSVLLQMKQ